MFARPEWGAIILAVAAAFVGALALNGTLLLVGLGACALSIVAIFAIRRLLKSAVSLLVCCAVALVFVAHGQARAAESARFAPVCTAADAVGKAMVSYLMIAAQDEGLEPKYQGPDWAAVTARGATLAARASDSASEEMSQHAESLEIQLRSLSRSPSGASILSGDDLYDEAFNEVIWFNQQCVDRGVIQALPTFVARPKDACDSLAALLGTPMPATLSPSKDQPLMSQQVRFAIAGGDFGMKAFTLGAEEPFKATVWNFYLSVRDGDMSAIDANYPRVRDWCEGFGSTLPRTAWGVKP